MGSASKTTHKITDSLLEELRLLYPNIKKTENYLILGDVCEISITEDWVDAAFTISDDGIKLRVWHKDSIKPIDTAIEYEDPKMLDKIHQTLRSTERHNRKVGRTKRFRKWNDS